MESLGKYILLEKIAQGGMAEVFRAVAVGSAGFAKMVAIKRILANLAQEERFVTMLIDEAKIASSLIHPNVVQVLDLGNQDGAYFIAMEYVVGRGLHRLLQAAQAAQTRLPLDLGVHVVTQALHGLHYAHGKTDEFGQPSRIIHRDISPQNIMVSYDGFVKLTDFGIARAAERSSQTLDGTIKGKPNYMAPEQVTGDSFDHRVDLYATGVVLHEILTMRRMRTAANHKNLLIDVATGRIPRLEDAGVEVPRELAEVVYRALAVAPGDRWPDARAMATALEEVSRRQGWRVAAPEVAAFMHRCFPDEMADERRAQASFAQFLKDARVRGLKGADPVTEAAQVAACHTSSGSGASLSLLQGRPSTVSGGVPARDSGAASVLAAVAPPPHPPTEGTATAVEVLPAAPRAGAGRRARLLENLTTVETLVTGWIRLGRWGRLGVEAGLGLVMAVLVTLVLTRWARGGTEAGPLVVETEPRGATVSLNGTPRPGATPLVLVGLPAGPVELEAKLLGMSPAREVLVLAPRQPRTVTLKLLPVVVSVPVSSQPPGAVVTVDGRQAGRTPLTIQVVGAEPHRVRVHLSGYQPQEHLLAPPEVPPKLELTLTPTSPGEAGAKDPPAEGRDAAPGDTRPRPRRRSDRQADSRAEVEPFGRSAVGRLTLTSRPWARVFIDGRDTGTFTPVMELPLPAGRHLVRLVNKEDRAGATFTVEVKAGQTLRVSKDLVAEEGPGAAP